MPYPLERVVVVGASLAGVRAAEALRRAGYDGALTVIGAEAAPPYDRPPLSKQVLEGKAGPDAVALKIDESVTDALRIGTRATGLDLAGGAVRLDGGDAVEFDGLIIATGATPRLLPGAPALDGVMVLRTLDDALRLSAAAESARRAVIVGAGFIGSEVASSLRARGLEVTVLEALPVPLGRAIGDEMGAALSRLHAGGGVDLRAGAAVAAIEGTGRVERVVLADGSAIEADIVIVGIGVVPATEWLEGSGIRIDNGVVCDSRCRVLASDGSVVPNVVAAGDVARWHNVRFGEHMRVEHWTNAVEQGQAAAWALLNGDEAPPYAPIPYFWSDQYGARIRFVGHAGPGDAVEVVEGSIEDRKWAATYTRADRVVAALTVNMPHRVMHYRQQIDAAWPVPA